MASAEALGAMLAVTRHRARDGQVTFVDPVDGVALAYCHTATFGLPTDVPSWHADETVIAAVDGEIFDVASYLQGNPSSHVSQHADAVVTRYEADAAGFPDPLDGVFSFFLWDRRHQILHLSSDPLGRKLLYYYYDAGQGLLVFSTELKAVLAHPDVPRELDRKVLPLYLAQGMAPAPFTLARGIRKLLPAECLSFGPAGMKSRRYWRPELEAGPDDFRHWVQRGRSEMVEAVKRTAGSADTVAVHLSGGIDSSVILAALKASSGPRPEAFTLIYKGHSSEYDGARAEHTAATLDVPLQLLTVDSTLDVTPGLMSTLLGQIDEPFESASRVLNEYFLGQAERAAGIDSVMHGMHGGFRLSRERLWLESGITFASWDEALRADLESAVCMPEEHMNRALVEPADLSLLPESSLANRELLIGLDQLRARHVGHVLRTIAHRNTVYCQYIPPLLGLEERAPLVDTRLALFWASIPPAFDGLESPETEKAVFREGFRDLLPAGFDRREKRAFPAPPLPAWLKSRLVPGLQTLVDDGIVRADYLRWLDKNCQKDRPRAWREAWQWFVFSFWYQFQLKRVDPFCDLWTQ